MAAVSSSCPASTGTLAEQAALGAHSELEAQLATRLTSLLEARLQRAICAVTSHLEAIVERQVREAHDGIAARIEDVTAAHIDRARSALIPPAKAGRDDEIVAMLEETAALRDAMEKMSAESAATRKRQDDLEAIVTRIATTTARDHASSRAEVASELRGLGGGIRLALDRVESELATLKQANDEDRAAASQSKQQMLDEFRAEFASRDLVTSRVEDLRSWTATEVEDLRRASSTPSASSAAVSSRQHGVFSGLATTHVAEDPRGMRQVPAPREGFRESLQATRGSVGHTSLVATTAREATQNERFALNLPVEEIDVEALEAHENYSSGTLANQREVVQSSATIAWEPRSDRSSTQWLPESSSFQNRHERNLTSSGYAENARGSASLDTHCQVEVHKRGDGDARAEHLQVQQARAEGGTGGAQGYSGAVA